MKKCYSCGKIVDDSVKFCSECGSDNFVPCADEPQPQNTQSTPEPAVQNVWESQPSYPSYPEPQTNQQSYASQAQYVPSANVEDKANVGLVILSILFPIVGIILFLVKKSDSPKAAKAYGIAGLVVMILNLVLTTVTFSIARKAADKYKDSSYISNIITEKEDSDNDWSLTEDTNENEQDEDEQDEDATNSSSTETNSPVTSEISDDWTKFEIIVGSNKFTLPVSYKEFSEKTGYVFKDDQDKLQTLKSNYSTVVSISKGDYTLHVTLANYSSSVETLGNCTIISVSAYNYSCPPDVVFPGGYKVGDKLNLDTVKEKYGKPGYEFNEDNYRKVTFDEECKNSYSKNHFTITTSDNIISEISISYNDRD